MARTYRGAAGVVTYQTRSRLAVAAAMVAAAALAFAVRPVVAAWAWWPLSLSLAAVLTLGAVLAVAVADERRQDAAPADASALSYGEPVTVRTVNGEPAEITTADGRTVTVAAIPGVSSGAAGPVVHWAVMDPYGTRWALTQDTAADLPGGGWWLAGWYDRPDPWLW